MTDRKLTPAEFVVLVAAKSGDLFRSELSGSLYKTFMDRGRRNVTAVVKRIGQREVQLLKIGPRNGGERPWLLTDAGRDALTDHLEDSR